MLGKLVRSMFVQVRIIKSYEKDKLLKTWFGQDDREDIYKLSS